MFGAQKNTFGQTTSGSFFGQSAFAKPTNTFGNNTFGQQNQTVFGAQPSTGVGVGGGLFGATQQPTPAPQSSFGGFGQQTSIFGQTSTTGSTSLFGAQQPSTFGAPKQMFGQPQQAAPSLFGQPQQQQQQTSLFGQTSQPSTGLFSSSTPSAFQPAGAQQTGTAIAKFQPQQETDTLLKGQTTSYVQTKQQCITFMKEYAEKSLEELRFEDYAANRKGPQAGNTPGLFGGQQTNSVFGVAQTSTPSGFGFGQQQQQQQQPQAQPLFGSNQMSTPTSAFGQTTNNTAFSNNLFGKPLGQTPATTASTFGGFGTNTASTFGVAKPMFGQPAPTSAPNLFGQPSTSTFGSTSFGQPTTSLFGTTATPAWNSTAPTSTATNTLFGANAAKPFGASTFGTTTSTFGTQPQTSTSSGFPFAQQNTSSIFAQKPAQSNFFGAPAQQTTATNVTFGQNPTAGGSLFGTTSQPSGGLFGSSQPSNTNTGGLFGTTTTNAFGSNLGMPFGSQQPSLFNSSQTTMQPQQQGTEIHQKIIALTSNPYGDSELFKGLKQSSISDDALKATNPIAQKALLESSNNFKISPNTSASKIRVKPVTTVITKKSLFDGLEEYDASLEESFTVKTNPKRLIIKPRSSIVPDLNRTNEGSIIRPRESTSKIVEKENSMPTEIFQNQIPITQYNDNIDQDTDRRVSWLKTAPQTIRSRPNLREISADTTMNQLIQSSGKDNEATPPAKLDSSTMNASILNESFHSNEDFQNENDASIIGGNFEPHPTGIVLRRAGYYTIPSLDELIEYIDENGQCKVPNFTIGRRGYGNVYFDEEIDVAGMNLDEICHFRNKEIILYQDDDNKPPVGEGLNRKAQVTLDQIWPHDKNTHEPIKDPGRLEAMDYEGKMRRICEKRKTKFLEYRPETGSCVFKVDHFSKYTLDDSDEEGEPRVDPKKARITPLTNVPAGTKVLIPEKEKSTEIQQETPLRMKQQEPTFILGPHLGQKGFQSSFSMNFEDNFSQEPTSPSIKLAKEMQTDTHKLQLMKASFFVEDDYDAQSIMSDATEGRESPDQMVPSTLIQKSAFASTGFLLSKPSKAFDEEIVMSGSEYSDHAEKTVEPRRQELIKTDILKSVGPKSQPLIIRPRVMLFDISDINLPSKESLLKDVIDKKNNTVPFFNGRRFKVCWTHNNEFTTLSSSSSNSIFQGRPQNDFSKAVIKRAQIKSMFHNTNENFKKSTIEHLKIQLKHNKRINDYRESCGGTTALREHFEMSQKLAKENADDKNIFDFTVWSLMESLWGHVEDINMEAQDHTSIMVRRDLLSSWCENVVTDNDALKSNQDYLDRLINLIMCHKVNDACDLAFENNDINLSMLIAQASGSISCKQLIQHQLSCWRQVEADEFIDERRLKILMIIAGIPAMEGPNNTTLNVFEDYNWLKCLALQLWYISSCVSSVTDSILAYEQNSLNEDANVALPVPSYCKPEDSMNCKFYDIRFHLMKLYSQRSHSLEVLLNPANYSKDLMDYRLSFFVLQILETLGYHHISESCRLKILTSFADQLETNGLWEWSIFVMLHISEQNYREKAIHQLLYRYIKIDDELNSEYSAKEKFILEDLGISEKWIFWAKSIRARSLNNHQVELKYLLKAKQWSQAHDVLMKHIAPDLFINDQIDYLKSLLKQFENTTEIQHWKVQGQILLNFIELNESFTSLNNAVNINEDQFLQQLSPLLSDLCSSIKLFPCPTPKHRLCQCEIAKQLAFIIRNFYATSNAYGNQAFSMIRTALEKLPLPQEFAQQELKHVLTTFLMERLTTN
ncbi:nuclear pore complex protein Nup98-Nup96 [Chironomus tepperi]|uniref:nuclear pore complex protein Nup98-Nup96 n=1 Tax=Chironomus tepperi TaxID=113505 RepID=UPI00391F3D6C